MKTCTYHWFQYSWTVPDYKQTAYQPIHPLPRPSRTVATDPTKTTRNATEVSPLTGSSHDAAETTGFQSLPSESGRLAVPQRVSSKHSAENTPKLQTTWEPPTATNGRPSRDEPPGTQILPVGAAAGQYGGQRLWRIIFPSRALFWSCDLFSRTPEFWSLHFPKRHQ